MTYIMGKNREDILKILKKTGDTVLVAKAEIIYALPPRVNGLNKDEIIEEIKKQPEAYEYYRAGLIYITDIEEVGETLVSTPTSSVKPIGKKINEINLKPLNCENCDLVAYGFHKSNDSEKICLHKSFGFKAHRITEGFKCPKEVVMGSGSVNDQNEFNSEEKWEKKKD